MSHYGLIKETSKARRMDTIVDLTRINNFLYKKKLPTISSYGPSIRAIENSIALGIYNLKLKLPVLVRGESFYRSLVAEIKEKEILRFNKCNCLSLKAKKTPCNRNQTVDVISV